MGVRQPDVSWGGKAPFREAKSLREYKDEYELWIPTSLTMQINPRPVRLSQLWIPSVVAKKETCCVIEQHPTWLNSQLLCKLNRKLLALRDMWLLFKLVWMPCVGSSTFSYSLVSQQHGAWEACSVQTSMAAERVQTGHAGSADSWYVGAETLTPVLLRITFNTNWKII